MQLSGTCFRRSNPSVSINIPSLPVGQAARRGASASKRAVVDSTRVRSYAVSDDDEIQISAETVRGLGSLAAVMAHFAAAGLEMPLLRMDGSNQDHR